MWHACPTSATCCYCSGEKETGWNWLLGAYCICLDEAHERFASSQACFHATGLCQKVIYYRPARAEYSLNPCLNKGEYGCWQSHATVNGLHCDTEGPVLILEDDVCVLSAFNDEYLEEIAALYRSSCRDVFYLGGVPFWGVPVSCHLWRSFVLCTEAYITNLGSRRRIVLEFETGPRYQVDQCYARLFRQHYLYPPVFSQLPDNVSSIGYSGWLTKCMHYRTRNPCLIASVMLSTLPVLIILLVTLVTFIFLTR